MEEEISRMAFPHARLSREKAQSYAERLEKIVEDLLAESPSAKGDVYGIFISLFKSPAYMQSSDQIRRVKKYEPNRPLPGAAERLAHIYHRVDLTVGLGYRQRP